MKNEKKNIWIEVGYRRFTNHGEAGLTVESLARELNKNKSSFYHYFGEIDVLKAQLLDYHLTRSKEAGAKIDASEQLDPDVFNIILEYKQDFLFHKQLRLEDGQLYKCCYDKAYEYVQTPILNSLTEALGLENKQLFSSALLNLVSDNFLLRIHESTLTMEWLRDYLSELRALTRHIEQS